MESSVQHAGGVPVAPFLTDDQYEMLFGEPRPTVDTAPRVSATRAAFRSASTTRWDRREPNPEHTLTPPPVPTLDLTGTDGHIGLDIFADDRQHRSMDLARSAKVRAIVAADQIATAQAAERVDTSRRNVRSRALSLAFAFAGLTATIALWAIAIVAYY